MTKSRSPMDRWIDDLLGRPQPSLEETPAFKPMLTASELTAERTTHVARQITEAERERRQANGAWLRQARLEKEERARAGRAPSAPKKPQPDGTD